MSDGDQSIQIITDEVTSYDGPREGVMRVNLVTLGDVGNPAEIDIPLNEDTFVAVRAARDRLVSVRADFFDLPQDEQVAEYLRAIHAMV